MDNPLGPTDVALSPDLQRLYPLGTKILVNGQGPYTVADSSYLAPGQPNRNTIELRDRATNGIADITPVGSGYAGTPSYDYDQPMVVPQYYQPTNFWQDWLGSVAAGRTPLASASTGTMIGSGLGTALWYLLNRNRGNDNSSFPQ